MPFNPYNYQRYFDLPRPPVAPIASPPTGLDLSYEEYERAFRLQEEAEEAGRRASYEDTRGFLHRTGRGALRSSVGYEAQNGFPDCTQGNWSNEEEDDSR